MSSTTRSTTEQPSFLELGEGIIFGIDCLVIGGTVCPGLLFCVPAILFAITPLIVIGLLLVAVALAMAVVASPVLLGALVVRRVRQRETVALAPAPPAPRLAPIAVPSGD
jgi:hypothetical protein